MSPASGSFLHPETQMLGYLDFNEMPNSDATEQDPFSNYIELLADQPEQVQEYHGMPKWDDVSAQLLHNLPSPLPEGADDELSGLFCVNIADQSSQNPPSRSTGRSSPQPPNSIQRAGVGVAPNKGVVTTTNPRKQNHSCDQCRNAKRACDLPQDVSINEQKPTSTCTTCSWRGVECTVAWLANRKSQQHTRKRPRTMSYIQSTDTVVNSCVATCPEERADTPPVDRGIFMLSREEDLARQLVGRDTLSQQFNFYVDVIDMPLSQCLLQGSMHPRYSLGIAALGPLGNSSHMSVYFDHANVSLRSCWETQKSSWASTPVAPHLFHAVSVLDSLFQYNGTQPGHASESRDASVTETYKWVTIATAAQFTVSNDRQGDTGLPEQWDSHSHSRDIATEAWRRAKQLLFKNISSVRSFRLALSLLLFGLIPAPNPGDQSSALEEDATFALCEGVRRIRMLCGQARACALAKDAAETPRCPKAKFHSVQMLPKDVREMVLELIAAIEWLSIIFNSIAVVSSRGKICPLPLDICDAAVGSSHSAQDPTQDPVSDMSSVALLHDYEIDKSIASRAKEGECAFIALLCKDSSEDLVLQAVRQSDAAAIFLWICLASFTLDVENIIDGNTDYEAAHRRYKIGVRLVELWRLSFGALDSTTIFCIQQSRADIRQLAGFCSNDGDLAVLAFCAIAQRLETYLEGQPSIPQKESLASTLRSSRSYRKKQRLLAAQQVATFAKISQGIASPGFQGTAGLKAHIQDIAAHPVSVTICRTTEFSADLRVFKYPKMVTQAYALAAKAFADEVHEMVVRLDMEGACEMTAGLDSCLQVLRGLQGTLVTLPDFLQFFEDTF
ncbi:hypothetical protein N7474_006175 [Penicillium riverlandense]|uniref:uncharacterized protein n=1 Tax=Penicillium riverlandense TaxID=1903569 RepID=UPI002548E923|nr:uncharacterized protein N7474_006175 [Penicillium riverlandense]KAJ5820584.1 hypothetical protein N7474_006175 [Penicillium riverlandense]